MKIRNKTLAILGISFIILFISIMGVTNYLMDNVSSKLEIDEINKDMERVNFAFETELGFEAVASDWAQWDDSYYFVQGEHDEYIDSNLDPETLVNLGLNMMIFYDAADQPYYAAGADMESYEEMEVSNTLMEHITSQEIFFSHSTTDDSISGIMKSPEGPLLIASHPIIQSSREETIAGTLVIARYLDDLFLEMMEGKNSS
ncbi:MAG: CHASE4 domain-containing protein [Methanolobus sp.]|nr:CHASE4 domain-containing protein [Methanolobus sp.]